ncbi:MAG: fructosamine kinase family protein [Actinobacteria bacterium]|nr:fructosamine kinase family protein [Actinomycetota bacterium]
MVGRALGTSVTVAARVHGGDVARAFRLELADGRTVFAKTHADPPAGFFTTEAAGLAWLREPGAVAIPEVLAVSDGDASGVPAHLVLEWIEVGPRRPGADAALGEALAALHGAAAPSFGRADRRTTGSRGLPNEPCASWPEFYATQRLAPLTRLAADADALPSSAIADLDRLADPDRLAAFEGADEPPARLHGDLWAGNRLDGADGRTWLVDPAAHGGHREFDLAMMALFGGFDPSCFAAYRAVRPLAPGWADRVALHQIAPLVVHAIKFGGSYGPAASAAISRYA